MDKIRNIDNWTGSSKYDDLLLSIRTAIQDNPVSAAAIEARLIQLIATVSDVGAAVSTTVLDASGTPLTKIDVRDESGAIITVYTDQYGNLVPAPITILPIEFLEKTVRTGVVSNTGTFDDTTPFSFLTAGINWGANPYSINKVKVVIYADSTTTDKTDVATWTTDASAAVYSATAGSRVGFPVANKEIIELTYSEYAAFQIIGNEAGKTHGIYVQAYN